MQKAMQKAIVNSTIISNGQFIRNKGVIIENGYIVDILDQNEISRNIETIDLQGVFLSPGFIDLQVMGAGGAFLGSFPSGKTLETMEKELLRQGTTGFLPTIATNSPEVMEQAIEAAVNYRSQAMGNFLGLHLEGPYINPSNKGAHPEKLIKKASVPEVSRLLEMARGEIKMMTIAPELQDEAVIQYLLEHSVALSMGHSGASYEEALQFLTGLRKTVTHLFNGMPPLHHRNPGLIPAVFSEKPYTSIVVDGIHVAYPMVRMAKEILGESLFLITDAATPATEGLYRHTFKNDRYVTVDLNGNETLSGSILTMLKAVQNCVEHVGISLPEAVNMATLYPARVIGRECKKGLVKKGYEAHLVAFDHDYQIKQVIYKGTPVFS